MTRETSELFDLARHNINHVGASLDVIFKLLKAHQATLSEEQGKEIAIPLNALEAATVILDAGLTQIEVALKTLIEEEP